MGITKEKDEQRFLKLIGNEALLENNPFCTWEGHGAHEFTVDVTATISHAQKSSQWKSQHGLLEKAACWLQAAQSWINHTKLY